MKLSPHCPRDTSLWAQHAGRIPLVVIAKSKNNFQRGQGRGFFGLPKERNKLLTQFAIQDCDSHQDIVLLQLLNTGHSGTISTVHASSAAQGIAKFSTYVLQSAVEMPYRAIKTNIADSLNVIIQMERRPGTRLRFQSAQYQGL